MFWVNKNQSRKLLILWEWAQNFPLWRAIPDFPPASVVPPKHSVSMAIRGSTYIAILTYVTLSPFRKTMSAHNSRRCSLRFNDQNSAQRTYFLVSLDSVSITDTKCSCECSCCFSWGWSQMGAILTNLNSEFEASVAELGELAVSRDHSNFTEWH